MPFVSFFHFSLVSKVVLLKRSGDDRSDASREWFASVTVESQSKVRQDRFERRPQCVVIRSMPSYDRLLSIYFSLRTPKLNKMLSTTTTCARTRCRKSPRRPRSRLAVARILTAPCVCHKLPGRPSSTRVCYTRVYPRVGSHLRFEGANGRGRELTLATRCHTDVQDVRDARNRCVHMALNEVHGVSCYGAHHLPAGKTVAKRKAQASCRSGSETDRRSTTATVQGIGPFCYDGRILGSCAIECQPIFYHLI